MRSILLQRHISMACILYCSAVRLHDSQACRKKDVTGQRNSRILELRAMLLSFQCSLAVVVYSASKDCAYIIRLVSV